MKNKNFDEFSKELEEKNILESIYQEWKKNLNIDIGDFIGTLNESYSEEYELDEDFGDDDERELTSGEKAALARDFNVLTDAQLAALYLKAKEKEEEEDGKYTIMINGIEGYGDLNKEGVWVISNPALADAIGISSVRTVQRTVNKFKNLLSGMGETSSEVIYPKLQKAFDKLSQMRDSDIANIAAGAIVDPENEVTTARDANVAQGEKAAAQAKLRKADQIKIGEKVHGLVQSLSRIFKDSAKAQRQAILKIAKEFGMEEDPKRIERAYKEYRKSKNI